MIKNSLDLGQDELHVWRIYLPDVLAQIDALYLLLSEKEQQKAVRFRQDRDRQSSVVARGVLRLLLAEYTGIPLAEITFGYLATGKPYLVSSDADVSFNVSHSDDWVVLVFGRNCNVGIDVEKIKRQKKVSEIAARYFLPEEIDLMETSADKAALFFQLWAYKEAYIKACGSALFRELGRIFVPVEAEESWACGEQVGWFFRSLEMDVAYASAVVVNAPGKQIVYGDYGALRWQD